MINDQEIRNVLREEYFNILPQITKLQEHIESEVRYYLLNLIDNLEAHQRIEILSRVKDCESAINALKSREEGIYFHEKRLYSLKNLKDLAGIRILVFPNSLIEPVYKTVKSKFTHWTDDPVPGLNDEDEPIAPKFYGHSKISDDIYGEIQIVPMLIGLFWGVEHKALYKPKPEYKSIKKDLEMKELKYNVIGSLNAFQEKFDEIVNK